MSIPRVDRTASRAMYVLAVVAMIVGAIGLIVHNTAQTPAAQEAASPAAPAPKSPPTAAQAEPAQAEARELSRAFRAAARQVIPTVVKIRTATRPQVVEEDESRVPELRENPFQGTPFEDFFRDGQPGYRFSPRVPQQQGLGSGVIIDPAGVIVTNNHVVEGADEVIVELADGREYKAADVKTDPETDLAVLRIKTEEPLPAARLGESAKMDIGDWVLAIGCPFDLDLTVSAGIISGTGRALAAGRRANFLQTDAAINPGNSGGPLVNLDGEVVGINTAIASNTGGYQGVGFAIPIDLAKWVTAQLIEQGEVRRAYLGVGIEELRSRVAEQLGVGQARGVLVSEVFPNTPAAEAGFQTGDVIVAFAGQPVATPRDLQEVVERTRPGSKQRVDLIREGKPRTLDVLIQALPRDFGLARRSEPSPDDGEPSVRAFESKELGVEVTELTEPVARQLGFEGVSGVLVSRVEAGGPAARAGIGEGMLVLRVGKSAVGSVADFREAIEKESLAEGVLLLVRTQQGNRFVVVQGAERAVPRMDRD